ncbi:MAG: hypothetical protein LC667_20875, partial [Thioalkalivibrio sp.]|nr:hypothetical protein [Thioalkalivibrio sp.]
SLAWSKRIAAQFPQDVCLLYIDLGDWYGTHRVFRALASALGILKLQNVVGAEDDDGDENGDMLKGYLVGELLRLRVQQRAPLVVLERAGSVLADESAQKDLTRLLGTGPLANGAVLLVTLGMPDLRAPSGRRVLPPLQLKPLSTYAIEILEDAVADRRLAEAAISELSGFDDILFPGIILRGADLYKLSSANVGARPSATHLAECILEAAEGTIHDLLEHHPAGSPRTHLLLSMAVIATHAVSESVLLRLAKYATDWSALVTTGFLVKSAGSLMLAPLARVALRQTLIRMIQGNDLNALGELKECFEAMRREVELEQDQITNSTYRPTFVCLTLSSTLRQADSGCTGRVSTVA